MEAQVINPFEVGLENLKAFEVKHSPLSEKMKRYIDIKRSDLKEKAKKFGKINKKP